MILCPQIGLQYCTLVLSDSESFFKFYRTVAFKFDLVPRAIPSVPAAAPVVTQPGEHLNWRTSHE
jgi:hypothetical protein